MLRMQARKLGLKPGQRVSLDEPPPAGAWPIRRTAWRTPAVAARPT